MINQTVTWRSLCLVLEKVGESSTSCEYCVTSCEYCDAAYKEWVNHESDILYSSSLGAGFMGATNYRLAALAPLSLHPDEVTEVQWLELEKMLKLARDEVAGMAGVPVTLHSVRYSILLV